MVSSKEMDTVTQVQILDETDCISHSTNTLGKGMNPIILLQLWINSRAVWFFSLGDATTLGEGKLWIQNLLNSAWKLTMSYPVRAEGLVNKYNKKKKKKKNLQDCGLCCPGGPQSEIERM